MNIPRDDNGAVDLPELNRMLEFDAVRVPKYDATDTLKAIYNAAIDDAAGVVESVWDPESIKDALEELKQ